MKVDVEVQRQGTISGSQFGGVPFSIRAGVE